MNLEGRMRVQMSSFCLIVNMSFAEPMSSQPLLLEAVTVAVEWSSTQISAQKKKLCIYVTQTMVNINQSYLKQIKIKT